MKKNYFVKYFKMGNCFGYTEDFKIGDQVLCISENDGIYTITDKIGKLIEIKKIDRIGPNITRTKKMLTVKADLRR